MAADWTVAMDGGETVKVIVKVSEEKSNDVTDWFYYSTPHK